jgi:hypothetical protein
MATFDTTPFTVTTTMDQPATMIEILSSGVGIVASVSVEAYVPARGTEWRLVVTDVEGNTIAELENAVLSGITYELNQPESWSFVLRQNDPKCKYVLDVPLRECQVWRGDQLLAWGPMIRPAMDEKYLTVTCAGAMWWLGRRFIGKADRFNYVQNGDFEDGMAHWDLFTNQVLIAGGAPNAQPQLPSAAVSHDYPSITGRMGMRMENFVDGADAFASQAFTWDPDLTGSPFGDLFTLAGYVSVEECAPGNAAFDERGLGIEIFSTTELHPDPAVQAVIPGAYATIKHEYTQINEWTTKGPWQRMEVELRTPPAQDPMSVSIRLYAPNGVVYWDQITLTSDERLGFYRVSQEAIVKGIVEHAQDFAYGKTNANITVENPGVGSIERTREYLHSEHQNVLAAIQEFNALEQGLDFRMFYTPTQRILKTYYPRAGTYKALYELVFEDDISSFTWAWDGESAANSVVVLGSGNGSDREEGFAQDQSAFSQGQAMELIYVAPPETYIESLDDMAFEKLDTSKHPVSLMVRTTHPKPGDPDPIGMVWPGDDIGVHLTRHDFDVSGVYRVVRVAINPAGTVEYTLNYRPARLSS